jgi:hypothetical protein
MRIDFKRLLIVILISYVIQYALGMILTAIGVNIIAALAIIDLALAFFFAYVNYPFNRKEAFRDPAFHKNVLGYFGIFLLLTLIQIVL